MTANQYNRVARTVIGNKLGFRVSRSDISLLEGGDDGKRITYVAFKCYGFDRIEYRATYNVNDWDLQILDTVTDESLYI